MGFWSSQPDRDRKGKRKYKKRRQKGEKESSGKDLNVRAMNMSLVNPSAITTLPVSSWLWGSQLSSCDRCVPGCASQRDTLHTRSGGSQLVQVGYLVTQFFDTFHLLIQVMGLDEVAQWSSFASSQLCRSSRHWTF